MERMQVFTLEAANALVPKLSVMVGQQRERRADIDVRLEALAAVAGVLPQDLTPEEGDPPPIRALKVDLIHRIAAYQEGWKEVEETGAVVKDPHVGLLDFYGEVDGRSVWLCWKFGEPEIGFYHPLDEGFAARRALHPSLRQRLLN